MIEVTDLSKLYDGFRAVNALSFTVQPGEVLGLVGPNGAGKTTTLRCLAGVIPATQGTVRICGHDLADEPLPAKQALAYFPDEPRLFTAWPTPGPTAANCWRSWSWRARPISCRGNCRGA
jgi:ABC-2 type transport system ATP-binding protein